MVWLLTAIFYILCYATLSHLINFNNLYPEKMIPKKIIVLIKSIFRSLIIKIIKQPKRDIISK